MGNAKAHQISSLCKGCLLWNSILPAVLPACLHLWLPCEVHNNNLNRSSDSSTNVALWLYSKVEEH